MASHRAQWKGHLKVGELTCAVGLYTAASTSERISFHMLNAKTGNRFKREFIDSDTEEVVEHDSQVKGFDTSNGDYIMIDPEEVAAVVPDANKMLEAEAFIPQDKVDDSSENRAQEGELGPCQQVVPIGRAISSCRWSPAPSPCRPRRRNPRRCGSTHSMRRPVTASSPYVDSVTGKPVSDEQEAER